MKLRTAGYVAALYLMIVAAFGDSPWNLDAIFGLQLWPWWDAFIHLVPFSLVVLLFLDERAGRHKTR